MKKLILTLIIGLGFFGIMNAQTDNEKLQNDIQKIEEQMQKTLKDFGMDFGTQLFVDTLFFKDLDNFELGDHFDTFFKDTDMSKMLGEMFGMMEEGMGGMESLDWGEFEKMLEQFGIDDTLIPAPENLDEQNQQDPQNGQPIKKKKKTKRKTYTL